MSSDIRDDSSMLRLFEQDNFNLKVIAGSRPISTLEKAHKIKNNPSMIEVNKFKTFQDVDFHKRTVIDNSHKRKNSITRNASNFDLSSKFNSHTIQCQEKKQKNGNETRNNRKRSLSKKENPVDSKKRTSVYNYIKKSVESIECLVSDNASTSLEKQLASDYHNSYSKDSGPVKRKNLISKKPKVSKPTKTITMTICEDGYGKTTNSENSLRKSKEGSSLRASIISKKTPQNEKESNKIGALCTTKP